MRGGRVMKERNGTHRDTKLHKALTVLRTSILSVMDACDLLSQSLSIAGVHFAQSWSTSLEAATIMQPSCFDLELSSAMIASRI